MATAASTPGYKFVVFREHEVDEVGVVLVDAGEVRTPDDTPLEDAPEVAFKKLHKQSGGLNEGIYHVVPKDAGHTFRVRAEVKTIIEPVVEEPVVEPTP